MDVDGSVRAMVGGRDYGASQFNRATDSLRQPGSSFKPYVYATALEHGLKPTSIVVDAPICIGNWCPHNYGHGYRGSMTLIHGAHAFDQHHRRAPVGRRSATAIAKLGRAKHHQDRARHGHHTRRCPTRPRCRSAPTASTCSTMSAPMPPSPISA